MRKCEGALMKKKYQETVYLAGTSIADAIMLVLMLLTGLTAASLFISNPIWETNLWPENNPLYVSPSGAWLVVPFVYFWTRYSKRVISLQAVLATVINCYVLAHGIHIFSWGELLNNFHYWSVSISLLLTCYRWLVKHERKEPPPGMLRDAFHKYIPTTDVLIPMAALYISGVLLIDQYEQQLTFGLVPKNPESYDAYILFLCMVLTGVSYFFALGVKWYVLPLGSSLSERFRKKS